MSDQNKLSDLLAEVVFDCTDTATEAAHLFLDAITKTADKAETREGGREFLEHVFLDLSIILETDDKLVANEGFEEVNNLPNGVLKANFTPEELERVEGYLGRAPENFSEADRADFYALSERFGQVLVDNGAPNAGANVQQALAASKLVKNLLDLLEQPAAGNS